MAGSLGCWRLVVGLLGPGWLQSPQEEAGSQGRTWVRGDSGGGDSEGAAAVWAVGLGQHDHVKGPERSWARQVRSTVTGLSGPCGAAYGGLLEAGLHRSAAARQVGGRLAPGAGWGLWRSEGGFFLCGLMLPPRCPQSAHLHWEHCAWSLSQGHGVGKGPSGFSSNTAGLKRERN